MSEKQRVGLYPGTFDPVTNGHIDIIRRASKIVDRLVIGVAINAGKGPLVGMWATTTLETGLRPVDAKAR